MSGTMSNRVIVNSCNDEAKVNDVFTKSAYASVMFQRALSAVKALSVWAGLLFCFFILQPSVAIAQTQDIDWADAGVASQGSLPSGTQVTGSDGTTATITWSSEASGSGTFVPGFAPTFVSYFNGTIGGAPSPLLLSFDNQEFDPADKITMTIELSQAVTGLTFSLGDLDQGSFRDAIEVFYSAGATGTFTNAASDNSLWTIGSAVQRTNDATVNGWTGISGSATADTTGNINFDFGAQAVQRIQIVYFSYTGTGDPSAQFIGFSDLAYSEPGADLSLSKQLLGSPPSNGGFATWRLAVTNSSASLTSASGVVVQDTLPSGIVFDSASGDGTFNSVNGQWNVGTLAPGQTATIDIRVEVTANQGTTITNVAEIVASSAEDPDSTPNNGVTSEDDFASNSFIVAPTSTGGTPPILPCPVGETLFDWDNVTWPGGSLSNSYSLASFGTISFNIVTDGSFVPRASFGGAVPALTTAVSGGLNPQELALAFNQDNDNRQQQAVTTVDLPRVFTGVQFAVFDIDRSGTFEDRVTVYGFLNGVRVNAILTNGPSNQIAGPSLIGNNGAGDTTADGTGVFTFLDPIDTIVIEYGNGPGAPNNPSNQSIAIHDFSFCNPAEASVSVSKVSSIIADPVNGTNNPKAIPGATVEYLITVTNVGNGAAFTDSLSVLDNGPADAKMCLISRAGGPIIFGDPGGNSDLTYTFASLGSGADDVEFSNNNGTSFAYTPVDDGTGCDANITDFRVNPSGAFSGGATFTITVRYEIE